MNKRVRIAIIVACFAAAAAFLFFRLGKGDPVTDEVELAFRSVGYMDFLATPFQTTPLEWFSQAPWWTRLSFHDHPPVVFALGYAVFQLFGDSLIALRSVFALLALGSLVLIYQIAKRVLGESTALLALAFGAVNTYLTWIGRIGLQEELVIFFTLLAFFFLIKSTQKSVYFIFWGIAFGLALLSKYTSSIILPISFLYLFYFNRGALRNKLLYLGFALSVLIFSPIIIYNIAMYQAVGHFDLQLASILNQDVSTHWQSLPGKEIGSFTDRIKNLYPNLWQNDPPTALIQVASLIFLAFQYVRRKLDYAGKFIFLTTVLYHLLIIATGPAQRFLATLAPWAIIAAAYTLSKFSSKRLFFTSAIIVILVFQIVFNYGTNLAYGTNTTKISSKLYIESAGYGYNDLEKYLHEILDTKRPEVSLPLPEKLRFIDSYRQKDPRNISSNPESPMLIIYDPRINQVAKLWLLDRRYYYDGWPIVSVDEYLQIQKVAPQYLASLGVKDYIYIASTPETFTGGYLPQTAAVDFEKRMFGSLGIAPEKEIKNHDAKAVFRIYHFSL